jgi:hypothetical protein
MGLIKQDGYIVNGVLITPAYAKITRLYNQNGNDTVAYFGISNTRENLEENAPLEEIAFSCEIDKKQDKIFNEVYTKAKEELFEDWEDDIQ